MKWLLALNLFFLSNGLRAEPAKIGSVKPVSVSYENIIRCFGKELSDPTNSYKVDMNRLKGLIDQKFATVDSSLRYRRVSFKDNAGVAKSLTLNRVGDSKKYQLSLQKIDDKGISTELPLSQAQRINPKPYEVAELLNNATVIEDIYFYDETKLNRVYFSYERHFQDVQHLELIDKLGKRSLSCDNKKDFGIICTCSLK